MSIKNSFGMEELRTVILPQNVASPVAPSASNFNLDGRPALPSYVETLHWKFPQLNVYSSGETYDDIVFANSGETISQAALDMYRLFYAKLLYIQRSFEQANLMQQEATGYHTISNTTTLIQKDVYKMKYEDAMDYAIRYEQALAVNADTSAIPIPEFLLNESLLVNQNAYELALSVISNFNASNNSLRSYFGTIEGIRRLLKRRILAAETLDALTAVEWADWPVYDPSTPMDLEG